MATKTRVTLEQFLAMPETEPPSELIDGEVIQKVAPNAQHALLTNELIVLLGIYLRQNREAFSANELRQLQYREQRVYLPGISVFRAGDRQRYFACGAGPIDFPPAFAIEVLSPGTPTGRTLERADFFMRIGTGLLWLVDPETETVTAYRPGEAPSLHRAPARVDARPVLSSFELDLGALFAVIHEGEEA